MNWSIFLSTFALIFLAELGDKTQLATLARAAGSDSAKWTVFLAAASALVVSTLVAVLFGSMLTKVVPERYIKLVAGVLFLVFGVLLLREAWKPAVVQSPAKTEATGVTSFVYRMAASFELAAFEDYRALADRASNPELKALLEQLAREEHGHFQRIQEVSHLHADAGLSGDVERRVPAADALMHNVAADDRPIVKHAIEHERATAGFYAELARITPVPALKRAFSTLAAAEEEHTRRLEAFLS